MSQLTSVLASKIAKGRCFLQHSQCWGSESCYQVQGRSSISIGSFCRNAGLFNAKIAGSFHPPILTGAKRREWKGCWGNGGMG